LDGSTRYSAFEFDFYTDPNFNVWSIRRILS
jgi:hypothetical protein